MLGCRSHQDIQPTRRGAVLVTYFGAVPDDLVDDSNAFQAALNAINNDPYVDTLLIPEGRYEIERRLIMSKLRSDLFLQGQGVVEIATGKHGFGHFSPSRLTAKPIGNIIRGQEYILCTARIDTASVLRVHSDSKWENGWGYKENDTHVVSAISGDTVFLKNSILFNYDQSKENVEVEYARPISLGFENITFSCESDKSWPKSSFVNVQSCHLSLRNIEMKDKHQALYFRGFSVVNSPDVNIDSLVIENLEYGVLLNYSRNIHAENMVAFNCRHLLVPANACIDFYANNILGVGCQSVIDAHQSFNIQYNNVKDSLATQFPNCRALGVKITNSKFDVVASYYQDYCYWSIQALTDENESLYSQYDNYFYNVEWIHEKPSYFNGITAYRCRNLIIKNCTTHNVAIYGKISGSCLIDSSEVGTVYVNSHNISITNTNLNGSLFPESRHVFRLSGKGRTQIVNCRIFNFDEERSVLFGDFYNSPQINSIEIDNCTIQSLDQWTNRLIYPHIKYKNISIRNTKFGNFKRRLLPNIIIN